MTKLGWIITATATVCACVLLTLLALQRPPAKLTPEQRILKAFHLKYPELGTKVRVANLEYGRVNTGELYVSSAVLAIPRKDFFRDPQLSGDHNINIEVGLVPDELMITTPWEQLKESVIAFIHHEPYEPPQDDVFLSDSYPALELNVLKNQVGKEKPENLAAELTYVIDRVEPEEVDATWLAQDRLLAASLEIQAHNWFRATKSLTRIDPEILKIPEVKAEYDRLLKAIPHQ